MTKKNPGCFFHKFSPQGPKTYKLMPRRTLLVVINQSVPFFVNASNRSEKGVNYHRLDDPLNVFTSVKASNSLDNFFVFKESRKQLKVEFVRVFFSIIHFNESEKAVKAHSIPLHWFFNEHAEGIKSAWWFFNLNRSVKKTKRNSFVAKKVQKHHETSKNDVSTLLP